MSLVRCGGIPDHTSFPAQAGIHPANLRDWASYELDSTACAGMTVAWQRF